MARGHIGGSRRLQFDPTGFLQGGGGDQGDTAMKMAMQLMGYGRGASPEELGLSREQLMANIAHQGAGEDIERQRLGLEEKRLGSQEEFQNWQKKAEQDRALAELAYRQSQSEAEKSKSRDTLIGKYLDLETDATKRRSLIDALSPEAKADTLALQKAREDAAVRTQAPALADAYKRRDWKTVKDITADITTKLSPEVLARPEFKWGEWNAAAPAQGTGRFSGGKGLLGMMWNTPGSLLNLGKAGVNLASAGLLGDEAPQLEYTEFTNPAAYRAASLARSGAQEGPVRSEAPLAQILEAMKFPNAVAPSQTTYNPTPGPTTQPEPYRYGTGNLPIPTTGLPELPVEELLSRVTEPPRMPTVGGGYLTPEAVMPTVGGVIPEAQLGDYAPGASFSRQGLPDLRYTAPHEPNAIDRILATLGLR